MIEQVLQAAATEFKDNLLVDYKGKTLPVDVKQHGGQFADDEIEKIVIRQPSVLLTVLNWTRLKSSAHLSGRPYSVNFAAVVAAVDGDPVQRRMQLVSVAAGITRLLEKQRWGLDDNKITAAELTGSRNLYSVQAQKKGLSLWAVTWSHELELLGPVVNPTLYLLEEVQGESDLHGSLDAALEMESSTLPEHGNLQDP